MVLLFVEITTALTQTKMSRFVRKWFTSPTGLKKISSADFLSKRLKVTTILKRQISILILLCPLVELLN